MINIPSYVNDPNYRYQMPALQTKVEGSGNGIKTNILNLPAVAKSLRIPPEYPLKFFGHELCTNTDLIVNKKTGDIKLIINGSFTTQRIIQLLDKFIEKYVLCPRCKLPESFIQVTKKNLLRSNCNACGKREYLDSTHKAANYIIKNPPKNMHEFVKTKAKGVQIEENLLEKDLQVTQNLETLSLQSPEVQTSIARLSEMVETQQPYTKVYEEMRNIKLSQAFDEDLKYFIIFKVLFGNELPQKCTNKYLLQILDECNDYKYSYKSLLIAMAHYFKNNAVQINFVSTVFKRFLDNEIFSENILLKWEDSKVKFKKNTFYNKSQMDDLQINAKDLLQWLKQAEEEDEDEEEEGNKQNGQENNQNGNSKQEEQKIENQTDNLQLQQKMLINQQIEEQKKQIEIEKQKLLELQQQKQEQQKQAGNSEDKVDLLAAKKEMDEEEIDINDI